jgi:hypothetical protein
MNKDFLIGFLVGTVLSLMLSLGGFYYYVVQEIQTAKTEAKENVALMKSIWKEELKDQVTTLATEKKEQLLNHLREKIAPQKDSVTVDTIEK